MAITALPALDRTSPTFKADADTFFGTQLPLFSTQAEAARVEINTNTATASAAATTATTQASNASAASASAQATASATAWVNGNTYALNVCAISQIDFQTYRKKTASSVTTIDPKNDATNWAPVSSTFPDQTGNSGKFLTTNGSTPSWGSVPPSALTLLATLTPTAAANLDFLNVFTSTYDNYRIIVTGVNPSADDYMCLKVANAGTVDSGSNYYAGSFDTTISAAGGFHQASNQTTAAGKGVNLTIDIHDANDSGKLKTIFSEAMSQSGATPNYDAFKHVCAYVGANTISGLRLYWASGANFAAAGKVRVYGFQNS